MIPAGSVSAMRTLKLSPKASQARVALPHDYADMPHRPAGLGWLPEARQSSARCQSANLNEKFAPRRQERGMEVAFRGSGRVPRPVSQRTDGGKALGPPALAMPASATPPSARCAWQLASSWLSSCRRIGPVSPPTARRRRRRQRRRRNGLGRHVERSLKKWCGMLRGRLEGADPECERALSVSPRFCSVTMPATAAWQMAANGFMPTARHETPHPTAATAPGEPEAKGAQGSDPETSRPEAAVAAVCHGRSRHKPVVARPRSSTAQLWPRPTAFLAVSLSGAWVPPARP
ncbi:hypothetical protein ACCO45_003840 [Purpureocillium lilacinum]|uniref:Uncharacterized protein n=1 Tax=Purpureocillium lilacinum TaxID=33203 RepID=A0ACC4E133_PURLI